MAVSKYDKLIEVYESSRQDVIAYYSKCFIFFRDSIILGMPEFLGDDECIQSFRPNQETGEKEEAKNQGRLIPRDDGFLYAGVDFMLSLKGNTEVHYRYYIGVKEIADAFSVKIFSDWHDPKGRVKREVRFEDKKDLKKLHNDFYAILIDDIKAGRDTWLHGGRKKANKLGFDLPDEI